jgi:hypothetical protein
MDTLAHIQEQIRINNYEFSLHAEHERENEHILVDEIEQVCCQVSFWRTILTIREDTVVSSWGSPRPAEPFTASGACCRMAEPG